MRFTPGCEKDERLHREFHHTYVTQSVPFKVSSRENWRNAFEPCLFCCQAGKRDTQLLKREQGERVMQLGSAVTHPSRNRTA